MEKISGPWAKESLFAKYFSELEDPRRTDKGNLKHLLSDILFLTISAILCGADNWELVKTFGDNQLSWLKKYGSFANGIPSSDTIGRLFSALKPESFNQCFIKWIESIRKKSEDEIIAVDGKAIRGANPKKNGKTMPHIVSAFASQNGLTLGQVKVDKKSNEITAIPKLLDLLAIEGCIVTIDAIGCQTNIASTIIGNGADYILAVKGNQGSLEQAILDTALLEKPKTVDVEEDFGHGRIEKRTCYAYSELGHVENIDRWEGLKSLIKIESIVHDKTSGKTTTEHRYYISSLPAKAKLLNRSVRKHWAVENNLHWTLDVEFGEDKSRKRKGYAAENHNIVLKVALTLLDNDKANKTSKRSKRLKAALSTKYREKLFNL